MPIRCPCMYRMRTCDLGHFIEMKSTFHWMYKNKWEQENSTDGAKKHACWLHVNIKDAACSTTNMHTCRYINQSCKWESVSVLVWCRCGRYVNRNTPGCSHSKDSLAGITQVNTKGNVSSHNNHYWNLKATSGLFDHANTIWCQTDFNFELTCISN